MNQPVIIDEETLRTNTPYESLVSKIEDAFVAYDNGDVEMPEKSYVDIEDHNGDFRSMPAYINTQDWEASGVKWVNVHPDNTTVPTVMGTFVYTDPSTGEPQALMNGTEMTKRRTAAVAALATKYLTTSDVDTLGLLGLGAQSYEQLRAISEVRDIESILVCDTQDKAVDMFKDEFSDDYIISRVTPDELSNADVLCTVTPSESPIIKSTGSIQHINAMGADAPDKQEIDPSILKESSVFVDDWDQAIHSGEVSKPISQGQIKESDINGTLGNVVTGNSGISNISEQRTVFDSTGLAIQDVATGELVMESVNRDELDVANMF